MEETNNRIKVLALVPYHLDYCAGQRFRIELWEKELVKRGIDIKYLSFTDQDLTDVLYQSRKIPKKIFLMLRAFVKQLKNTISADKPDVVFIYREAALVGPPLIEKVIRRWNIPIIYDIDEPHFIPNMSSVNKGFSFLKFFYKFDELIKTSTSIFAVNKAIADYTEKLNDDVSIVPMAVDVERYKPSEKSVTNKKPIIGWVGTWSNQPNIAAAVPALRKLRRENEFTFRIIADIPIDFEGLDVEFFKWDFDIEVPLLQDCDIGVIPVKESDWSPWKFFFKTIQFMSLGMPVVASSTGSNVEIIEDGVNGFLVNTDQEWYEKIKLLINNPELREKMGQEARKTAVEKFDIVKQYDFLENKIKKLVTIDL